MFCGKCGASNNPGTRFCGQCGHPLPAVPGQVNSSPGAVGNPISSIPGAPMMAQSVAAGAGQVARTAVNAKILGVVITAAIVTAGIILYNMFFVQKPMDIVEKFIAAINEKDMNTAISCLDPAVEKAYKAGSSILSNFIGGVEITDLVDLGPALMEMMHANGDATDLQMEVEKVSEQTSGNDSIIVVKIKAIETNSEGAQNTEEGNSTFKLHKYNDGWRISDFE